MHSDRTSQSAGSSVSRKSANIRRLAENVRPHVFHNRRVASDKLIPRLKQSLYSGWLPVAVPTVKGVWMPS